MSITAQVIQAFAPTGKLRASINLGNPVLAKRDPITQEVVGISVDMARALGQRLGVEVDLMVFEAARTSVDAVAQSHADIGFFAIDPLRGIDISFTAPYLLIEGCYLVPNASAIQSIEEVDRVGNRVAVGKGSAYDLFLTREIKHAEILRSLTPSGVVEMFLAQNLEVAAGVKQALQVDIQRFPGLRQLPGHFMLIQQAMGCPMAHGAEVADCLRDFVEDLKANGFLNQALARHSILGCCVAPVNSD